MMAHARQFGRAGLGGADIHPAVNLARIGVDDLRAQALSDLQGQGGFADPGGSDDEADLDRQVSEADARAAGEAGGVGA